MSIIQHIDIQGTGPRIKSRDRHKVIVVDQSISVQVPRDIDRYVALVHHALDAYRLARIHWRVPESEWHYLGRNWEDIGTGTEDGDLISKYFKHSSFNHH